MNKKKSISAVLLILLLVAAFVTWLKRPVAASMDLALTGTPGLKVAGTVIVDGVRGEFSGVLPAHIKSKARSFEYTILMQEPRGELTVANGFYGSSAAAADFAGVKGSYSHTWTGKGVMTTTVRKAE